MIGCHKEHQTLRGVSEISQNADFQKPGARSRFGDSKWRHARVSTDLTQIDRLKATNYIYIMYILVYVLSRMAAGEWDLAVQRHSVPKQH